MARRERRPLVPDFHLWTAVADSVDPLRPRRRRRPDPAAAPLPLPAAVAGTDIPELPRARPRAEPTAPSYSPAPQGRSRTPDSAIEPRLHRRLRRGQVAIDATLDLHGLRQDEARATLQRFLVARAARGARTVLVITGKGLKKADDLGTVIVERGVLRAMLPVWLSEPQLAPLVAGWSAAAQAHGGEGAFYVRLRPAGGGA